MSLSLLGAVAVVLGLTSTASAPASGEGCAEGVAVVVDFTDLGGEVEVGCAAGDPVSGREALEQAGFTPTDSMPGLICAIDSLPDPCPEEFDGSFWSYWTGEDGQWVSHVEGADSVDPAPGDVEGWRYNDGSTGPGLSPAEVAAALAEQGGAVPTAQETATAGSSDLTDTEAADDDATADASADDGADEGGAYVALWWTLGGVVAIGAVLALVVRARRV